MWRQGRHVTTRRSGVPPGERRRHPPVGRLGLPAGLGEAPGLNLRQGAGHPRPARYAGRPVGCPARVDGLDPAYPRSAHRRCQELRPGTVRRRGRRLRPRRRGPVHYRRQGHPGHPAERRREDLRRAPEREAGSACPSRETRAAGNQAVGVSACRSSARRRRGWPPAEPGQQAPGRMLHDRLFHDQQLAQGRDRRRARGRDRRRGLPRDRRPVRRRDLQRGWPRDRRCRARAHRTGSAWLGPADL
jgi:hypothetical protein